MCKKIVSLKTFRWTRRKQFRQLCQKLYFRGRKPFVRYPHGILKKSLFQKKNLSSKISFGHVECYTHNPADTFPTKVAKKLIRVQKKSKKAQFSFQKFRKIFSRRRKMQIWNPANTFLLFCENYKKSWSCKEELKAKCFHQRIEYIKAWK